MAVSASAFPYKRNNFFKLKKEQDTLANSYSLDLSHSDEKQIFIDVKIDKK